MKKNIFIIRHFETTTDNNKNKKISYKKSLIYLELFVNFIKKHISENPYIKSIKFYTSEHDRTIITAYMLFSKLQTDIILNNIESIDIHKPEISDIIDRDPKKNKHQSVCKQIINKIEPKFKSDTLYIFITHSSLISNLFKCFYNIYTDNDIKKIDKKIHSYSLSFISKIDDKLTYKFNVNMRH